MGMNIGVRSRRSGRYRVDGFTVVETMIVLAVTGGLFVAIAATLSGRQNAAEFTHAIQSVQSQIQQTINQVSQGFYPNQSNFGCANGAGTVQLTIGTNTQGTNQDCVFLGKVMQFGLPGANGEAYQIYTIAGLRCGTNGVVCPSASAIGTSPFYTSQPTVLGVGGDYADYSTSRALEYGLTTAWVRSYNNSSCTSSGCSLGSVAFLMEPGSLSSTGTYNSGAQQVDLIPIVGTTLTQNMSQAATQINTSLQDSTLSNDAPINPSSGVQICFKSGGTNQSGLITIGGSGRQLLVTLAIKSNSSCM